MDYWESESLLLYKVYKGSTFEYLLSARTVIYPRETNDFLMNNIIVANEYFISRQANVCLECKFFNKFRSV